MIRRYKDEHEVALLSDDDEHYEEYTRNRHSIYRSFSKSKGKQVTRKRK